MEERIRTPTSMSHQRDRRSPITHPSPQNPFSSPERSPKSSRHAQASPPGVPTPSSLPQKPSPTHTSPSSANTLPLISSPPSAQRRLECISDKDYTVVNEAQSSKSQPVREKHARGWEMTHVPADNEHTRDPEKPSYEPSPRLKPHHPRSSPRSHRGTSWRQSSASRQHHHHHHHHHHHSRSPYNHTDTESDEEEDEDEKKESGLWVLVSPTWSWPLHPRSPY